MSISFAAQTGLVLVDARPKAGRCYLPLSATLQGRTVTVKDQFGVAGVSSIQIYTNSPDTFEDGTSSRWISQGYGFMTLAATASNVWTVVGGTTQQTFQASTLSTFMLSAQVATTVTAAAQTLSTGVAYIGALSTVGLSVPSPLFSTVQQFDTGTGTYVSMALSSSYIYLNGAAAPTIVIPSQLLSSIGGLGNVGFVSSLTFQSTIAGLGTATYVSSPSLRSSLAGLGSAGYVSTTSLYSTLAGLGTLGYISTTEDNLRTTSTIAGLGGLGFVSSQSGLVTISSLQTSTIAASMRGIQFLLAGTGSVTSTGVFYSQDGVTASNATLLPQGINFTDAAVSSNGFLQNPGGTEYVLATDSPSKLYVSNNLTSWTPVGASPTAGVKAIGFGSNSGVPMYVATTTTGGLNSLQFRRSTDTNFMPITTAGGFSGGGTRVAYNPASDRWVASGTDTLASTLQYTTTLTSWTASAGPTFSTVANSVIWAPGFSRFYAVGKANISTATIKMSADGITWSNAVSGGFANCNLGAFDIAYGNVDGTVPTLVAVGEGAPGGAISTIQWSTDGLNFSNATAGGFTSNNYAAGTTVAYSATLGQWMAAGGVSSVLTSANGKSWTNAAFQSPTGFTPARIIAPNTAYYTTLPLNAGPEAMFQGGRQIVDTGYLNNYLATKSFGTSTFSTLTVAQGATITGSATIGGATVNLAGLLAATTYGTGSDTLTIQTTAGGTSGGVASLYFGTPTYGYPLGRIAALDTGSSYDTSALIFQNATVAANSAASGATTFQYVTTATQPYTVPAGVTSITVKMWGGGGSSGYSGGTGGAGAYLSGTLSVVPGQVLNILVGGGGSTNGGYGGGGGAPQGYGAAGGGRSAIQTPFLGTITGVVGNGTTATLTTSIAHNLVTGEPVFIAGLTGYTGTFVVASAPTPTTFTIASSTSSTLTGQNGTLVAELVDVGGGGGGSQNTTGGNATYTGTAVAGAPTGGGGGSQTAGGAAGSGAVAGSLLAGGAANNQGGGGGGYYGGGGGYWNGVASGGGGGSSWSGYLTNVSGANSTNGYSAPGTAVPGYVSGVAAGNIGSGGAGGNGLVIIVVPLAYNLAESMRISNNGYLGIGTTAPAALLDVAGTSRAQTASTLTMNTSTLTVSQKATLGSATIGGATVNLAGLLTSNTYGTGSDTLTIQTTAGGTSGGVASLFFGTPTYGYPLGRIAALDTGSTYDTSALIFQNATVAANSAASGAMTFQYISANPQSYTVPNGVTSVTVKMWGAAGGDNGTGGAGAFLMGTLAVTPGQVLSLIVGGSGNNNGYGGGGAATQSERNYGGGRSAIQTTLSVTITGVVGNGTTATYTTSGSHGLIVGEPVILTGLTNNGFNGTYAVVTVPTTSSFTLLNTTNATISGQTGTIVAELVDVGGGGGPGNAAGGAATYTGTASSGSGTTPGGGGSQTAGGFAGGAGATAGSLLQGGTPIHTSYYSSGGGGGGYYGGGGAYIGGTTGGGGGGSSWSGLLTNVSGANSVNGTSPPGTGVSGYITGVAAGGNVHGDGLIIIVVPLAYNLAESMRISNNGYLGIGTTTPGTQLDVAGVARASTTITGVASVSSLAIYDSTTPSTGSLYQISSVLYYNNTAIGGVTAANIQAFTF